MTLLSIKTYNKLLNLHSFSYHTKTEYSVTNNYSFKIFLSSSPLTSHKLSSEHLLFLKVSECKKKMANDELRLPRSSSAKTLFG